MNEVLDLATLSNLAEDEGEWLLAINTMGNTSSNVYMIRYDPHASGAGELGVWFWRPDGLGNKVPGPQYFYPGITRTVFNDLLQADSIGKWVHWNLVATHWPFRGPVEP